MRTTIKDIAESLDVNMATVSRALSGKPGVSQKVRKQVKAKAAAMKYRPNVHARGLATNRTETIGLICDLPTEMLFANPFWGCVLAGIEAEARKHDYALMFASVPVDPKTGKQELPKFLAEHRVDGLLGIRAVSEGTLKMLLGSGYELVLIDCDTSKANIDTVLTDNHGGSRLATEHLINLGHRNIGFVGTNSGNISFHQRFEGYQTALKEHGLPVWDHEIPEADDYGCDDSSMHLLDRRPDTTAIVCCNDDHALAAMRMLALRGLSVPKDISVVGFDDILPAAKSFPPLTTVRVDSRQMGRLATSRLIERLDTEVRMSPCKTVLSVELIERESTATPRENSTER